MKLGHDGKSVLLYIPKYQDNDKAPPEERMECEIHAPTVAVARPFTAMWNMRRMLPIVSEIAAGLPEGETVDFDDASVQARLADAMADDFNPAQFEEMEDHYVGECVTAITNLTLDDKPIPDGKQLIERCPAGDRPLIRELAAKTMAFNTLDEDAAKNSASQSGGPTGSGPGTAESASETAPIDTGTAEDAIPTAP